MSGGIIYCETCNMEVDVWMCFLEPAWLGYTAISLC
jgi:hypothetical protein